MHASALQILVSSHSNAATSASVATKLRYVPSNEKRTIQRESMDALRADLGLGEISDMEYRQLPGPYRAVATRSRTASFV